MALCCASSGFAAALYPGGRTAHNLFKIDVRTERDNDMKIQCSVPMNSQRAELLRSAQVIIWDEFVMSSKENFEAVDSLLRAIRRNNQEPCGGVVFIGAGDFRQIPPIVPKGEKWDIIRASIKSSKSWPLFRVFTLKISMRQADDLQYSW